MYKLGCSGPLRETIISFRQANENPLLGMVLSTIHFDLNYSSLVDIDVLIQHSGLAGPVEGITSSH